MDKSFALNSSMKTFLTQNYSGLNVSSGVGALRRETPLGQLEKALT